MQDAIPSHELDAREELAHELGRKPSIKAREAIYNVLQVYPKARLVRSKGSVYSIDTLGEQPGVISHSHSADGAWLKAARAVF